MTTSTTTPTKPGTFVLSAVFSKAAIQLAVALAVLGLFVAGAYTGHFTAAEALGTIGILIGLVGVISVSVLNSPQPNSDLIPHLIFTLAVLAGLAVLLFHNVVTSAGVVAVIGPILGGSVGIAGMASNSNAIQSMSPAPVPELAADPSTLSAP